VKTNIKDYIARHGLIKRHVERFGQWIPSMLLPEDADDEVEFYGNDDGTHVVVLNTTRKRFKIVHGDLLYLQSDWKNAEMNYETDASPFWNEFTA
jgi:hypothetical protein